jgi:hypothetical protein
LIIIAIIIAFIIIINLTALVIAVLTESSLVLKIKPLNRAFIFAHGSYTYYDDGSYSHTSTIADETIHTYDLVQELIDKGYTKIWISMCEQGNEEYILTYSDGTNISWPNEVSRVTKPGTVYPIYLGLGVYRLVIGEGCGASK